MLHIDTTAVSLQNFYPENLIITSIDQEGTTQSEVARQVKKPGAITCIGNIRSYVISVVKQYHLNVTKYVFVNSEMCSVKKTGQSSICL